MTTPETHHPIVLYPGKVTGGRPTVEVHTLANGTQEAYLVPPAAAPIATGIKVFQKGAAKSTFALPEPIASIRVGSALRQLGDKAGLRG